MGIFLILIGLFIATASYASEIVRIAPLTTQIVSTATTATGTETALPATALKGRESIAIHNVDSATETVWIGPTGVTSANGFPLNSTMPSISLDLDDSVVIYVISDGTSVSVRTCEIK